jgi:hypothetical protein
MNNTSPSGDAGPGDRLLSEGAEVLVREIADAPP